MTQIILKGTGKDKKWLKKKIKEKKSRKIY